MAGKGQEKAIAEFLAECEDILEEIGGNLVKLEEGVKNASINPEVVNSIFRGAHSLKGLSGMLGFSRISELSHNLENMLDNLRLGKLELDSSVLDCLFECLETLGSLVARIGQEGNDDHDITRSLANIDAIVHEDKDKGSEKEMTLEDAKYIVNVLNEALD